MFTTCHLLVTLTMIYAAVDGNIADLRHLADCAVEVLAPVAAGTNISVGYSGLSKL